MEQQLVADFLRISADKPPSLHALTLARSLIINPSTSDSTISSIFQTLTLSVSQNQKHNPNYISLHHIFTLLYDLSLHRPHLRHHIFAAVRTFSLLRNDSTRSVADSLALLVSLAEHDSELLESVSELSESLFLSACFGCCISVRHWLLMNARRLLIRPSLLITVFLGFTKDPYPYIRKVALDGLSSCIVTDDRAMMEGCYWRGVELLSDMEDCVRSSAVRVVSVWGKVLVASSKGESKQCWSDALFEKLCSIVRDMSVTVRLEAFDAIGKIKMVSENILLQTLSKKVLAKAETSNIAGAFVHGIEDEYHEVRRSACVSLCSLFILSSNFACKALSLLVDMLNDDSITVRLQALQAMHHMAKHDNHVQEEHLNMLFDTLFDTSTSIRHEARRVIQLLKLHSSAKFKMCVNSLIDNMENYPQDEADIIFVLFNIGRNHGRYAVSTVEEASNDIDDFFGGKFGSSGAKTASFLVLAISAPLSNEINTCKIPPRMFSYSVTLLGRISRGLAYVMDKYILLSYLCACSRSEFVSASELIKGNEPLQQIVNDSKIQESWEPGRKQVLLLESQLEVNEVALVKLVLAKIGNIWLPIQIGCIDEVHRTLRSWKEELKSIRIKSPQSVGVSVFALKYVRIFELFGKAWTNIMSPKKLLLTGKRDIDFGKLDYKLREMLQTFLGLNKEIVVHLLELILATLTLELCCLDPWCNHSTVKKLDTTYSVVELLIEKETIEPSKFLVGLKKLLCEVETSHDWFSNFFQSRKLLEMFTLKQVVLSGELEHIKVELDIVDNTCENPLSYVSGLPVGIPLQITLYNIVPENRLWLKMTVSEDSYQFVYLDLEQFGDCGTIKKITYVAPFYKTPKANFFKLTVSIGMECLYSDQLLLPNCKGPKHELIYLCKEKEVYLSGIVKQFIA